MNRSVPSLARPAALALLLVWLAPVHTALHAQGRVGSGVAASDSRSGAAPGESKRAAGKATPRPQSVPGGSSETPAERNARLKRECKGRPDAGACSGYTR